MRNEKELHHVTAASNEPTGEQGTQSGARGHIDIYQNGIFSGWAFDPTQPDIPAQVRLYAGQILVAEGYADQYRPDIEEAGIGNGSHGFNLKLLTILPIGKPISIKLLCNETWVRNESFEITLESSYKATLCDVDGQWLKGEIVSINEDKAASLSYCMFVDDTLVGEQQVSFNEAEGRYPVEFCLPADVFDGKPHLLSLHLGGNENCQAHLVTILRPIFTPWQYLATKQDAVSQLYAGLPAMVARRLSVFQTRVARILEEGSVKDIEAIWQAQKVLDEGYENREKFPLLTLPKVVGTPDVSIIIPVHNKFELTYHCLASLILSDNRCTYEVIVIDDCSSDQTKKIKDIVRNVKVIVNESNLGFLRNCNKAAKMAKGRYLVLLNNDTEVGNRWLDEMLDVFQRFDKVGAVGAKLTYPDGKLQEAGGVIWDNGQPWNLGRNCNPFAPEWNYVRQCDYLSGAALMLPKPVWDEVGGLSDEFAPCYYEDTDLAFKVRAAGYRTMYCPHSEVIHFEGMSHGRDTSKGFKKYQAINAPKFAAKWVDSYLHNGHEGTDLWRNKERGVRFRALVIDYATPEPEKNAGAYAAVQEMRLLQAHGFKLTFVPENLAHFGKYTIDLQKMGVECIHAPFYVSVEDLLQKRGNEFDLVFITRYNVAERYIDLIRKYTRAKVLFNNADLHFLRELRAWLAKGHNDLSGPLATRDRELGLMRKVDAILSYNETEHAVIASHNLRIDNIFKCPWVLPAHGHTTPFEKRQGIAFLGGYRHHPNVEAVEFFVQKVMPLLKAKRKDIQFHIYGSHPPKDFDIYEDDNIVVEGFVETLDQVFENCRLFVAPLLSGAGIKGKVLEAMSWGVPSVLSPVAAEATGLSNGISTLIAETPAEWVEAIIGLYDDEKKWQAFSDNSLTLARNNYSFEHGRRLLKKPLEYLGFFSAERGAYAVAR